jgi:hypothetical protein
MNGDGSMDDQSDLKYKSARELLTSIVDEELSDPSKYDPEVVALVQEHILQSSIHTQAGARLANALLELARTRSAEVKP